MTRSNDYTLSLSAQSKPSDAHADYSNPGLPQIDSGILLGSRKRMLIRHGEKRYLLRQTRRGKLILTGHED